ncbi:MAG: ATP-binding protein [Armatimonadota bacterium]
MPELPAGTVTFLFTDIEGSTNHIERLGDAGYAQLLAEYRRLVRAAFGAEGGHEIQMHGEGFLVAFQSARSALRTAVAAQRALSASSWPGGASPRVRMALHTGEAVSVAEGYVGLNIHRAARICSVAWGGQILLSKTTRVVIGEDLPDGVSLRDLGEHRLKDLTHPQHLFQVLVDNLPADFPPLRSLNTHPNNLPIQLTSFIGRDREMADVKRMLATSRLVTLTGAGGAGKTRLALQVAADLLEQFPDGVWLVELASVAAPALIPQRVAAALGVREEPIRPLLTTLQDYVQSKEMLLMLDNCEHMVTACGSMAETLLRVCPKLRIIATSQHGLRIAGEWTYRVPSLSLPDLDRLPPVESLTECEAVRLFVERARACRPEFAMTRENARAVAQVCSRLDGIPLAIELAAARVKLMSVEQTAARLGDRFRLLGRGSRTAPPRHQTLRAAMDWSYELLAEQERTLLRRLAVFAGGWTLEAAEAIYSEEGRDGEGYEVLDLLSQLVDKSLVMGEEQDAEFRYRMLETVRQYGLDKLVESGEAEPVRGRHRDWCLRLAEQAEPELQGRKHKVWLGRLEREHDNLRAALEWSLERGDADIGLRLAGALWWLWFVHGHWREGRQWLERALSSSSAASVAGTGARAKAIYGAAALAWRQWDHGRAAALAQESLTLCRDLEDKLGIAISLTILGQVALRQGNFERARAAFAESHALYREIGHTWGIAATLLALGFAADARNDTTKAVALYEESARLFRELGEQWGLAMALRQLGQNAIFTGDYARATALLKESLMLCEELGDTAGIAYVQNPLGIAARAQGDYARAASLHQASLTLYRQLGDNGGIAYTLSHLGMLACQRGDNERAAELLRESLAMFRDLGDRAALTTCLEGLAEVAAAQGQHERAARLSGAAAVLREATGAPLTASDRAGHERAVASARAALPVAVFAAAWAEGRAMSPEAAAEHALARS